MNIDELVREFEAGIDEFMAAATSRKRNIEREYIRSVEYPRHNSSSARIFLVQRKENVQSAVLKMKSKSPRDQKQIRSDLTEAFILSKLTHPNVCRMVDHFVSDKLYVCIEMQTCERTLHDAWFNEYAREMPTGKVAFYMHQILSALKYCHANYVIHGDLKMENVGLVDNGSRAVLLDFGASHMTPFYAKHRGLDVNSCGFKSPEVLLRLDVTTAADMWAAGLMLVLMHSDCIDMICTPNLSMNRQQQLEYANRIAGPFDAMFDYNSDEAKRIGVHAPRSIPLNPTEFFSRVPDVACGLLQKMLIAEPTDRITADVALLDVYFAEAHISQTARQTVTKSINQR